MSSAALELTEEQMRDVLAKAREEICAGAVKAATATLQRNIEYATTQVMQEEVTKFMQEEIVPQMREVLLVHKSAIVEAAVASAHECAEKLREAMVKALTERLAEDYKRREIFKAMFGDRY